MKNQLKRLGASCDWSREKFTLDSKIIKIAYQVFEKLKKVTPAHDPNDFEIAQRYNLEIRQVIDFFGRLNEKTGPYQGLKIEEARIKVVTNLEKAGLIKKIDRMYRHKIAVCYKCNRVIEPMVLDNQWFIKMSAKSKNSKFSLRDLAINAVKKKQIKFIPQRFQQTVEVKNV